MLKRGQNRDFGKKEGVKKNEKNSFACELINPKGGPRDGGGGGGGGGKCPPWPPPPLNTPVLLEMPSTLNKHILQQLPGLENPFLCCAVLCN